uniref:PH domain-containing protein n=1 Tax=Zonotrichia albicollis TaxID=44394 RepID=A0A8D2MZM6_ZONAL
MALVKSGWLWRQSSILRRWKRNWFVLYLDGSLVYYHDETQRDMDGRIHIKYSCRDVRIGRECKGRERHMPLVPGGRCSPGSSVGLLLAQAGSHPIPPSLPSQTC